MNAITIPNCLLNQSHSFVNLDGLLVANLNITPFLASAMLELNGGNRNLRTNIVNQYADDMKCGKWHSNSSAIAFDISARLTNGQHRLTAGVKSNSTFKSLIVCGLNSTSHLTEDIGAKKSLADFNVMAGRQYGRNLASVVTVVSYYLNGQLEDYFKHLTTGKIRPTPQDQEQLITSHPELVPATTEAAQLITIARSHGVLMPCSVVGFINYFIRRNQKSPAELNRFQEWLSKLATGTNCDAGCPALLLRNFLTSAQAEYGKKPTPHSLAAVIFKSWIAFRDHRKIKVLKFAKNEAFPLL